MGFHTPSLLQELVSGQLPYFTLATRPNRICQISKYAFSNWATTSNTCDALYQNKFYASTFLPTADQVEQWCVRVSVWASVQHGTPVVRARSGFATPT